MTGEIQSGLISRRGALSLIGVALGAALPPAFSAISEAEAQTPGMERRDDRLERREERRDDRLERREDRRDDRVERREERRGVVDQPATTGSTATTGPK